MSLLDLKLRTSYRTGEFDPVLDFFSPCLGAAKRYSRAVGYFRSTVYQMIGPDLLAFASRGGLVRVVCSPNLTPEDIQTIQRSYDERIDVLGKALLRDLEELLDSARWMDSTRLLGAMVRSGSLDIRVAFHSDGSGIYHEKLGMFEDAEDGIVSFIGSSNETLNGWSPEGNYESIEVFSGAGTGSDSERAQSHLSYFERLWGGLVSGLEVVPFPRVAKDRLVASASGYAPELGSDPVPKRGRVALPHQSAAIENWRLNGYQGILEHATGSGKTFTAIIAIRDHVGKGDPVLVLVPSLLLLDQWDTELRAELPNCQPLLVGGGHISWKKGQRLQDFSSNITLGTPRIVVATMQTACTEEFRTRLTQGRHLLVVADEVHQIGSEVFSGALGINSGKRLGLSATPTRYGDPEGTERILSYFKTVIEPKYTLVDAIKDGRLTPYEYFPIVVNLTADEMTLYGELTEKIGRQIARDSSKSTSTVLTDATKLLLIRRARIAKKAVAKVQAAAGVLSDNFDSRQLWLVYCEDLEQMENLRICLIEKGLSPIVYYSNMDSPPKEAIEHFRTFGGIMLSIRCLDEGVDIPSVSHAVILASSQNPRQFIQRRGRVLRRSENKTHATIWDLIVVPDDFANDHVQTALTRSELTRAIEFSTNAINKNPGFQLRRLVIDAGIDPDELIPSGIEED